MSAAAEKLGLSAEDPDDSPHRDLDEARRLITALAGLGHRVGRVPGTSRRAGARRAEDAAVGVPRIQCRTGRTGPGPGREVHRPGLVAQSHHFRVERISSRPMTVIAPLTRRASRYSVGARGGRLDRRHHRHPVSDRERLAGHPVGHQGAARVRQRLHLQLPRHQLRVGVRAGPAGGRAGGPQAHRLVDPRAATWSRRSAGTSAASSPARNR